jgi:hypothetical protein
MILESHETVNVKNNVTVDSVYVVSLSTEDRGYVVVSVHNSYDEAERFLKDGKIPFYRCKIQLLPLVSYND